MTEAATLNSRCSGLGVYLIQRLQAKSFQAIQPTAMFGLAHKVLNRSQNYLPVFFKKLRGFTFLKTPDFLFFFSRKSGKSSHARHIFPHSHTWLGRPLWEAGYVFQSSPLSLPFPSVSPALSPRDISICH